MKEGSQTPSSTMKCHVVTSAKVSEPNAVNRPKRVKQRKIKKPCRICKSADKCQNFSAPQCGLDPSASHFAFWWMMDSFCRETFFGAVFFVSSGPNACSGLSSITWFALCRPTATLMARIVWEVGIFFLGILPPWATGARGYIMDLVPQNSSLYHLIYGGLAAIAWILRSANRCNQFGKEGINREGKNFDRNLLLLWTM